MPGLYWACTRTTLGVYVETVKSPAEGRVVLHNVSWETYEHLLADHVDSSAPRFAYDRGTLEITSPNPEHEETNRNLALLVEVVAEEFEMDLRNLGSTTFRREDLERGFEPDSCFYFQNEGRVRGKTHLGLSVDPPPDLVVEIDITSPSLNKLPIYARIGTPEVWRYDGTRVTILRLEGAEYVKVAQSAALPPLSGEILTRFVREGKALGRRDWTRKVCGWAREHSG